MARDIKQNLKGELPETHLVLDKFNRGLITLVDESLLVPQAATESFNLMQTMDGRWSPRWGTDYYGATTSATLYGAGTYTTTAGATHLVVHSGTAIKRSTDNGTTWDTCSGATMTASVVTHMKQIKNVLYIANGTDALVRYDGSTTLLTYSSLSTPSAPSIARTVLTAGTNNLYYRITAINAVGESIASSEATITVNKIRDNWIVPTEYVTLTITRVTSALRYNIYFSDVTGVGYYLDSVADPGTGTTFDYADTGERAIATSVEFPTANTTTGPKFGPMEISGNRIWATLDPDNPWRVYWGGTGTYQGAFSTYYGGGYIDLELGGRERPKQVVHYRDGRGGAFATVLTSDPEGNGSIWQISLDSTDLGNTTVTIPTATKIVGSVGTTAPLSVTKVRNDIFFFNSRGWFSLGTRPQMLNLLSTDEISSNIRPDIQSLTGSALSKICAYYYQAKVFVSVPFGSTTNNYIYINDTERKNWAGPWSTGVERFFEYADTSGNNHLLAVPVGGARLLEISEGISGDLSTAFETRYISGLLPVDKDRNAFAKIRYAYVELNNPVGNINFSVLGTTKRGGFTQLKSITITDTVSNAGFGTFQFSNFQFSDASLIPTVYSQSSVKKRIRINKLLNNIQFKITTSARGDSYTLLTLSAKGYVVPTGDPPSWKTASTAVTDVVLTDESGTPLLIEG